MATPAARLLTPGAAGWPVPPLHHPGSFAGGDWMKPRAIEVDQTPGIVLQANPNRYGAYLFNNGGKLEIPIDLGAGLRIGAPLPLFQFIDSASINVAQWAAQSTFKSLAVVVDTAIAWTGNGQSTVQLLVGRDRWGPKSGAASGAGLNNALKGAAVNLGPATTPLAAGVYPFSPADLVDLQWQWPYIGLELKFFTAVLSGSARLLLQMPNGPTIGLGLDQNFDPARTGDAANSFPLEPNSPALFIQTDRELYAAAAPGGVADLRIWEVLYRLPSPASYPAEHG